MKAEVVGGVEWLVIPIHKLGFELYLGVVRAAGGGPTLRTSQRWSEEGARSWAQWAAHNWGQDILALCPPTTEEVGTTIKGRLRPKKPRVEPRRVRKTRRAFGELVAGMGGAP